MKTATYPGRHPVFLFYAVGARWIQVLLSLLNLEVIGRSILPVWEAVQARESKIFLMYLGLAVFAFSHAYYTFPMNVDEDMVETLYRTARLFIIADFDVYELQGVDSEIHGSVNNSSLQATISEEHRERLDGGVRQFICMALFIGPVLFLNVFIGVLGSAYEDARAQINEIFTRFRLGHLKLLLLRTYFWQWTFLWCDCLHHTCRTTEPGHDRIKWKDYAGVWIKLPKSSLEQEVADKEFFSLAKEAQLKDVMEKLLEIEARLPADRASAQQ